MNKISVLFVCLGNICRSPAAEAIFLSLLEKRELADRFIIIPLWLKGKIKVSKYTQPNLHHYFI